MIPLSTAVYDPKWYHMNHDQLFVFKDKNGVYNGLRIEPFMPGEECCHLCRGKDCCETKDPSTCEFLKKYREQLDKIDFNEALKAFSEISNAIKNVEGFSEEPIIVLIVHEAPQNPCSERRVLVEWFRDHGYELEEFTKN